MTLGHVLLLAAQGRLFPSCMPFNDEVARALDQIGDRTLTVSRRRSSVNQFYM
ncbi:MAG: hypothetical protein WAM92_00930 [Mycobacterium sp.]